MSEPPNKKRKTILDFFRRKEKGKKIPAENLNSKKELIQNQEMANCPNSVKDKVIGNPGSEENGSKTTQDSSQAITSGASTSLAKPSVDGNSMLGSTSVRSEVIRSDSQNSDYSDGDPTLQNSPDLFDSETNDVSAPGIPERKPSQKQDDSLWKGKSLAGLNRKPTFMNPLPPLKSQSDHHVLFKVPHTYNSIYPPIPHPHHYSDKWDSYHVRMPCSHQSDFPYNHKIRRRWEIIESAFKKPIPGPMELADAICKYNTKMTEKNFQILYHFCIDILSNAERRHFFENTLPKMIKLALSLPNLITQPIPLLKRNRSKSITMSQEQVACLLANAFFCTFPRRNARGKASEYFNYPSINFSSLYDGDPFYQPIKLEKLKCIFHYFRRVTTKMPAGVVTFTRQSLDNFPDWKNLETKLTDIHVSAEGTIEDDGDGLLQVDFANKYLGGGVLGMGAVQEEIRFLICPEMLVTRLFTECLEKNESLIMMGCERFSNYSGYAGKFEWSGDFVDQTERDAWGRLYTDVIAIDALVIREHSHQFRLGSVIRELNKAYSGFYSRSHSPGSSIPLPAVCTGNWGCGAFGGDKQLKALIQMMAATMARREVCYYTFDDKLLRDEMFDIHTYLTKTNCLGIGNILTLIEQYGKKIAGSKQTKKSMSLFQYIPRVFDGTLENTDSEPDSPEYQRSDSREMQFESANETGKPKIQRTESQDYKADTP
ncbi:poly(ADP-ribose) glycohydrolase-like isoform X2 [Ostrea edulis]|nr:poly(ADP-ribose) glycohydrolase-like isoform X2 [Ostrea edulis]